MIKQLSIVAAATLAMMVSVENESHAHGFGGYHGAVGSRAVARNVNIARGINVGVRAGAYRPYGYRGPGYAAVGNRGLLVPGYRYGYDIVPLGPAPGPGPRNLEKIVGPKKEVESLRMGSKERLNQAIKQSSLPSDAGLPASKK